MGGEQGIDGAVEHLVPSSGWVVPDPAFTRAGTLEDAAFGGELVIELAG